MSCINAKSAGSSLAKEKAKLGSSAEANEEFDLEVRLEQASVALHHVESVVVHEKDRPLRLNARSRALPTISCGGWKPRKHSDNGSRHRTDSETRWVDSVESRNGILAGVANGYT